MNPREVCRVFVTEILNQLHIYANDNLFSAGIGRSGTLIVLDYVLDVLNETEHVNIQNIVLALRQQRFKFVQTVVRALFCSYHHYCDKMIVHVYIGEFVSPIYERV